MKTLQKVSIAFVALALLSAAGCTQPLDLSIQRNRIFLMGRLLVGQTCDVRVTWRKAPNGPAPVTVTADMSEIGGTAEQELVAGDNGTWRWSGQVAPDASGERLITITALDSQNQKTDVSKRFRVFDTDKAIAIDTGGWSAVALKADGTVVEWNFDDGIRLTPPAVITDITAIAAGYFHRLALKTDGTVAAWGCDNVYFQNYVYGQCDIPAGLTDVVAIAAGYAHSLALKADGTVVAWGAYSDYVSFIPMYVPQELTDVVAIATSNGVDGMRSVAVQADGAVMPWPHSYMLSDVVSVSVGNYFDLAVKSDGTVEQIYSEKPLRLPIRAGRLKATAVDSGDWNDIVLQEDGSVVIWANQSGGNQLFGTMVFHRLNNIIAVSAVGNSENYLALAEDGSVISWKEQWTKNLLNKLPVPAEVE
jgi:alpha-tubulin suppressor-like RCC1 family protein